MIYLMILFIGVPLIELSLLIKIGVVWGVLNTVLLVIGTGVFGAYLARIQGLMILRELQYEINQGRMPAEKILDGMIVFCSGILLLTPGLLTDICGFLGLIPGTRRLFKEWLKKKIRAMIDRGSTITIIKN
ncbi:MAG: FxsA family protein [Candidatus Omnitrophica bacterium]|nr:FxsA family protein [Candidatus Omnitrophota bacterium]